MQDITVNYLVGWISYIDDCTRESTFTTMNHLNGSAFQESSRHNHIIIREASCQFIEKWQYIAKQH